MPREKKNVNQSRGADKKSANKKKDPSKEQCYYGKTCKRKDCFYKHDNEGRTGKDGKADGRTDTREAENLGGVAAFPPLAGTNGTTPRPVAPSGAWGAAQPAAPAAASSKQVPQQAASPAAAATPAAAAALAKSAWKPAPPPQPAPVWGSGINPVLANHSSPPPPPVTNGSAVAQVTPNRQPAAPALPAVGVAQQRLSDSALNINAKEFVPGNL